MEDGDEEELEEAEIERFLDPLDCSSDADSSIAIPVTAVVTTAGTAAGQEQTTDDKAAIEEKDTAAAKPKGKANGASADVATASAVASADAATASATPKDALAGNSADRRSGDKATTAKGGPKKSRKASAPYPIGTEISKDFGGVGKCIQSEWDHSESILVFVFIPS